MVENHNGMIIKNTTKVNAMKKLFLCNRPSVVKSINVCNQTNIHGSGARLKGNRVFKIAYLCSIPTR